MLSPLNLSREKNLIAAGFKQIAGIDEAGRGCWAGPVVAACLNFDEKKALDDVEMNAAVADSKLLSPLKREKIFAWLIDKFDYGVGVVDNEFIDQYGIIKATRLAMKLAVDKLAGQPDYLLIDAVDLKADIALEQEAIIKGDRLVWSIAAASIIAKVWRDQIMVGYHREFSCYCFNQHKGYGTNLHRQMIAAHGICPIHRRSYQPIAELLTG